ncbi:MAG: ATP phosphoribosyltransferase regulatory subunit, partial [Planctomycetales bacterium]
RELCRSAEAGGASGDRLKIDVSIARGLDYYTGTVFETTLTDLPQIGSVCSGGRYDNLAELYTKQRLPGVGASLGLDRLLAALEELGKVEKISTPAPVFMPFLQGDRLPDYLGLARRLRAEGIGTEVYPDANPKGLGKQLGYAGSRGFRVAVIVGAPEFEAGECQVRRMSDRTDQRVPLEDMVPAVREMLG